MTVAVKVTDISLQTGFADGVMLILTGAIGMTTIVISFEFAGFPVVQPAFDVSTQVTISPFTGTYE